MNDPQTILAIDPRFALFAVFVALAFTTEAAIGFGSMLLAVTLGALLYPIATIVPVLVCLSVAATSYIVTTNREHVAWRLLLTRILPGMVVGMIVGYSLFSHVPNATLKVGLGIFVIAFAAIELRRLARPAVGADSPFSPIVFGLTTLAAGVVHGITATGGPVLVYALGRQGLSKGGFRATLLSVWLPLNTALAITLWTNGRLGGHEASYAALLAPVLAVAVYTGQHLHGRLDERTFRIAVLVLLLFAGLMLAL